MKNIQRMVLMVLVCWGMVVGNSYGQNVPNLIGDNLVKVWDKTFGGTGSDIPTSIVRTKDNGCLIIGNSLSFGISGNKTVANRSQNYDLWIIKLDNKGFKVWDKILGGMDSDGTAYIKNTNDGNYIIAANSASNIGGDKTQNSFGGSDYWLIKIDENGNKIWDKTFGGNGFERVEGVIVCKDGGFLLGGMSPSSVSGNKTQPTKGVEDHWFVKTDKDGNKEWDKSIGDIGYRTLFSMTEINDGFLFSGLAKHITGNTITSSIGNNLIKIDKSGNIVWEKQFGNNNNSNYRLIIGLVTDPNNFVFIFRTELVSSKIQYVLSKIDSNGLLLWEKTFLGGASLGYGYAQTSLILLDNGNIICSGISEGMGDIPNYFDIYSIYCADSNGNLLWEQKISLVNGKTGGYRSLTNLGKNEFLFCTESSLNAGGLKSENSKGGQDYWAIKFSSANRELNRITGNIYNDLNANCQLNPNESGLKNILLRATPGNYNTITDNQGNYTLYLDDIGSYRVTPILSARQQGILAPNCNPNFQNMSFTSLGNIKSDVNFAYKALPCADLTVDIVSSRRRRCFRNFTTVKYANEGYLAADNVQLKVIYPKYVVPIRSSTVWTSLQDSVITYNLGRLEAGQTGQIVITDSVVCGNESIRGLTQCTKAIISPKSSCVANNPNWDKADLQAFSQCVGGNNAKLSVINTGEAMRDSTVWRLFLNGVLKQQGRLKLGKGENYSFEILAKGNTIRLEADQTPNHPVGKYALTTIERCGGVVAFSAVLPPPSVQLPININASGEEIATSCMPIIDSYDPNDKQVIPAGVGTSNIVRDSDELEFQVRFQNTGSDTAYTVVIRDTLSTALDIASLQVGAASHKYTYTVSGKNNPIITWTFDKINLPAQKQNDLGSNGFVKFKIAQMPNNAKGTRIKNKAGIYFDFNSAIITNETNLTVGDLVSDLNNAADLATIFVCNNKPQPTSSQAGTDKITASDSLVLSANLAEKGTGIWKVVQGTGVFTNASNPKTTVKKIGLGENIYEWSVSLCNTISTSKVKITKVATPKAEITTKGDTLIVEIADSYQWFLNGQAISGATSQSFIAKTNGTYTVEIKKFGVTVISPAFKHTITGIEDELLQKSTTLIPNPAQNTCVLQVRNDYFGEVKLSISNLLGQIVFQTVVDKNETNLSQTLDLQHFTNGIYFIYLQTAKGKVVKKLVKM